MAFVQDLETAYRSTRRAFNRQPQMIDWQVGDAWQNGTCIVDTELEAEGEGLLEGMDDERASVALVLLKSEWPTITPEPGMVFRLLDYGDGQREDDRTFEVVPNGVTPGPVEWRVIGLEVNE